MIKFSWFGNAVFLVVAFMCFSLAAKLSYNLYQHTRNDWPKNKHGEIQTEHYVDFFFGFSFLFSLALLSLIGGLFFLYLVFH